MEAGEPQAKGDSPSNTSTGLPIVDHWPSLLVVSDELARHRASLQARINSLESKSGLVLGFSGILIAQVGGKPTFAEICAQSLAFAAAILALAALWPRRTTDTDIKKFRDSYVLATEEAARQVILDTNIGIHMTQQQSFVRRIWLFRFASISLATAGGLLLLNAMIEF